MKNMIFVVAETREHLTNIITTFFSDSLLIFVPHKYTKNIVKSILQDQSLFFKINIWKFLFERRINCSLLFCNESLFRVIVDLKIILLSSMHISKHLENDFGEPACILRSEVLIKNDCKKCTYTNVLMKKIYCKT